ncbi:DNA repair protein-like protein [Hapsidospora chrysogenum ATCC 11550]|uniref:DNA repair protein rad9 n=1 Tax=Hapsidospora chrysogenum (strain ATCC 11550 / CBS 779.69 / DSM 880 / IAM 14645 / JCM 23072 / IMI 49137) TaxID=857340 RepID=A0A086T3K0_HAPC1|nr:DNA repair protein-like protein [Hapsidospora chrysogenum ATCC 11550]
MAVLTFTLSEEGVGAFRDALICLNKFSDDVSLEARRDSPLTQSQFVLSTLNTSKSAYGSFKFQTHKFFSRYQYHGNARNRDRFYCTLYIRALIYLFRSRASVEGPRDADKQSIIERCDVAIEDGEGVSSRFITRIIFRNGLTSTHRLPFEVAPPVHAKFNRQDAPHHWSISSRTLRQLTDHFGPGIELLDINTDGDHVNFTCFSEKTVTENAVLKKPLQTSIAVEADEFDEIDVEDKLHIVISIKDFRAIIQHAGITGNDLSARYSLPARPIQLSYSSDAISCEFLIMTVGERSSNPSQKTKKGRKGAAPQHSGPRLEAASRRTSVAPSETRPPAAEHQAQMPPPASRPHPNPTPSAARASASRIGAFDLRPTQNPPPPTNASESLFVEDEGWEPVRDEDDDEDNARLEWDHSADPNPSALLPAGLVGDRQVTESERYAETEGDNHSTYLEPTQKLSDIKGLALFPD